MREDLIEFIKEINREFEGKLIQENIEIYVGKLLENAETILHYSGNQLVGCLAFYANDYVSKKAFISFIGIRKTFRDKGLGKILLNNSIAYLKNNGFQEYGLEVIRENGKARDFYIKQGFIEHEIRKDRIFMIKNI